MSAFRTDRRARFALAPLAVLLLALALSASAHASTVRTVRLSPGTVSASPHCAGGRYYEVDDIAVRGLRSHGWNADHDRYVWRTRTGRIVWDGYAFHNRSHVRATVYGHCA